jgi:hypothetical protein
MLSITLQGLDRITNRLDAMRHKVQHVQHVDIAHEMADWEVQDVHRHRPGMHHTRIGARTKFRPHSRYEMRRHQQALRRLSKRSIMRLASTRPILRQVMIERLRERMVAMLDNKLKW